MTHYVNKKMTVVTYNLICLRWKQWKRIYAIRCLDDQYSLIVLCTKYQAIKYELAR